MPDTIAKLEETNGLLERALEGLSAGEALAMNCIMSGGTMTAAAEAAGVSRQTLYQWLKAGTRLSEAVTVWKQDLATTARTRLLMMTDIATRNILEALKGGDAKLAMVLMQKLGILSPPAVGPTHVEAVTERVTVRSREEELSQSVRLRATSFVESWTKFGDGEGVAGGLGRKRLKNREVSAVEMASEGAGENGPACGQVTKVENRNSNGERDSNG